jgi:hypothetical protein
MTERCMYACVILCRTNIIAVAVKPVFHFNRIVTYRSIFFCVEVISSSLVVRKQRNTLRFATIRSKWKTGFKLVFHFNRTET